jgi:hypothetical protein
MIVDLFEVISFSMEIVNCFVVSETIEEIPNYMNKDTKIAINI